MNINPIINQPRHLLLYSKKSIAKVKQVPILLKNDKVQFSGQRQSIMNKIIQYFKNYPKRIDYTWQHKKAFLKLEKELLGKNTLNGYLHDADKLIFFFFGVPKSIVRKIHTATAPHHIRNGKSKNPTATIIDWECARFTKPDKPLTAREFYEQRCPKMPEIEKRMKELGL